ncbi:MAG: hypothetical protein NTY23_01230 [Chloroflexi bacterium]|nr:hypothetical protein [Chloroflexota bacterium]
MIRAVIDTSLLVRALIKPQGTVGPLLLGMRDASYLMLYSDALLGELADVLARPRLSGKYGLTRDDIATVLSLILLRGELVAPARRITACRPTKQHGAGSCHCGAGGRHRERRRRPPFAGSL